MTYTISFSDQLKKTLTHIKQKDKTLYNAIQKKILQIGSSDETTIIHYKNLRKPLHQYKRVHIGSYVLLFQVKGTCIYFETLEHHDNIYHIKR